MNVKKDKGSIAIFVLVALLFMSAFLIISFASNVNKSKTVKEQFNIISGIYAYANGEEGAYDKAYSDLRNKNKQTMTASIEKSSTLELTKTFDENMSNYRIYGNSVQNGTPTPDNPIEVQSVGKRTKNLCPQSFTSGYPVSSGWASAGGYTTSDFIEITSGKTYTGSIYDNEYQNINKLVYVTYDENKNFLAQYTTRNITPTENEKYIRVRSYGAQSELINSGKFYFQLEEGTQSTEYEPYGKYKIPIKLTNKNGESKTTNIYLDEPLRKVGNYADYIDFENQKVVRNIKEVILTGNENWSYSSGFNAFGVSDKSFKSGQIPLCTHLKGISVGILTNDNSLLINTATIFIVRRDLNDNVELLKSFLANENIKFINPLATPTEETITLPQLKSYEDYTKIEVLTDIAPSKIEAEYVGYTLE